MKKAVSLIISLLIILSGISCAAYASGAGDEALCFAVASDIHFNLPREELEHDIDDDIFFYGNRRAAMEDESGYILDEFLSQCADDEKTEYVLISGDLADDGRIVAEQHETVAAKLRDFEEKTGKSVFVCNGNHDTGAADSDFKNEDFRRVYGAFGYDEALDSDPTCLSYTVNLGKKYRLIVGDSCDPTVSTEDGLTQSRLNWIIRQAKKAYDEGRYPVLMMHHNLLDHMPAQRLISHNFIVRNHTAYAEQIANAGIKVVLTGHEHGSDAISYTSASGNTVTDFSTTSLTMYPLEYRVFSFTDNSIDYSKRSIDKIDTDALAANTAGFTDEQIALMNEDFGKYSKDFFKACIRYRLTLALSAEKLGIKESDFYYDFVMTAVNSLTDILAMPLYGPGSVEELAATYNIEIPASDYADGWDVVTEVLAHHYVGGENCDLDSPEVRIILNVADLVLLHGLSAVNDETAFKGLNLIFDSLFGTGDLSRDFTRFMANTAGPVTVGEYFLVGVASPLIYGLAYDRDGLDDNNGSIPGYGVNNKTENISDNLRSKIGNFFKYFSFFFKYFLKIFRIG